jgi:hypothetical protein
VREVEPVREDHVRVSPDPLRGEHDASTEM